MFRNTFPRHVLFMCAIAGVCFVLGRLTAPAKYRASQSAIEPRVVRVSESGQPSRVRTDLKSGSVSSALEVQAALKQLDQTAPSEQREDERLKLLLAWAATDPLGAMDYARQNLKRDRLSQAMSGIATEWAKHDPTAAWGWARSMGPDQTYHAHTVLEEVGKNNPAMAEQFAAEFAKEHPEEAVAMCLTAMRGMTYCGNFDAARKLANEVQLNSPEEQATLLNFMAGQWARFEPEKAAEWVQSLPQSVREQALIGLGESWAENDPPRAADFASQLPAGSTRQGALRQAIANWILTDPVKASTWVNQFQPHEDFDQAVASVATMRFLVEEHVDLALNWADTIFNESLRVAALNEILSNLAIRDRTAALNYARSDLHLSPELREQLVRQLQASNP